MNISECLFSKLPAMGILASAGLRRLDWFDLGAGSVSKTAAFIVLIMAASWGLCAIKSRFSFWVVLAINCILGYFLIHTYSRGSLISLAAAFIVFLILSPLRFSPIKGVALACAILAGIAYSNSVKFTDRMNDMLTLESSSANVRYDLYTAGLKMLTDAPDGFQTPDTPAKIYMRWYQRMYDNEEYTTLVNSHLEFLNRNGIPLKLAYILFWSFIFCICFSYKKSILSAAAFAVWICFFLNSAFSNIATFWLLWTIPLLFLLIGAFINRKRFLIWNFYASILAVFALSTSALFAVSYCLNRDAKLKFKNGEIVLGPSSENCVYIYSPSEEILGRKYGIEIIDNLKNKNLSISIGTHLGNDRTYNTFVISGIFDPKLISNVKAKRFIFLNPVFADKDKLENFFKSNRTVVILGEITDFRNINLWKEFCKDKQHELIILSGVENYIPDWTKYFLEDENP